MVNHKKYMFFLKNISWLMIGRIFMRLCSLLILPIATKYLEPEAYGIISLFLVEASFLSGIYAMGLQTFGSRMILKYDRRLPKRCYQYIGITLIFLLVSGILGMICSLPLIHWLKSIFLTEVKLSYSFLLYVPILYAFLSSFYGFTTNSFLDLQQNKKLIFCEFVEFFSILPAQIIGLIWFHFTWEHIVIIQLIGKGITTVLSVWLLKKNIGFSFKRLRIIKLAMKFSLPLVPISFVGFINQQINKIFLANLVTMNSVGIYSVGSKLGEFFSFFSRPAMTSVKPEICKRLDEKHSKVQDDIRNVFSLLFQLSIFFIFAVSIFTKEIVMILMDKKYHDCFFLIPFMMFSLMFSELSGVFHLKFVYKNKTGFFTLVTFVGAFLQGLLSYVLIMKYQLLGAAVATLLSRIIIFFLCYFLSQSIHKSRYDMIFNCLSFLGVGVVIYLIQAYFPISFWSISVRLLLTSMYAVGLFYYFSKTNHRFQQVKFLFLQKFSFLKRVNLGKV